MLARVLITSGVLVACCVPLVLRPFGKAHVEMHHLCGGGGLFSSPDAICSDQRVLDHKTSWEMSDGHLSKGSSHSIWAKRSLRTGYLRTGAKPSYLQSFRLLPMTFGLGVAYVAYLRYRFVQCREKAKVASAVDTSEYLASDLEVFMYKMLPLGVTSRFAGWVANVSLPVFMRPAVLGSFARSCGCNVNEAAEEDLTKYRSLSEFFRRELKPGLRPVHSGRCIVSPADGTVLHFGPVSHNQLEQVKGISYSLPAFFGPITWGKEKASGSYSEDLLQCKEGHSLFQCVVYLAPGDYHRFHSPVEWTVQFRRHFPGELLSVRPGVVYWIAGLFNLNERVAYVGRWKHGFFSMVAVGATSVGSIKVDCDPTLVTNSFSHKKGRYYDQTFSSPCDNSADVNGVHFGKGQAFGEFNFGSTIVLVFEAPKDFEFTVQSGQHIKYGERLLDSAFCQRDSGKA